MSNGIGSGGVQLSDVYQDDKEKNGYARLFRKHNGFSPDQILKAKQAGNEIREKAITDKIDRLSKAEGATIEADQHLRKLMAAAKALSNNNSGATNAFGARSVNLTSSAPDTNPNNIVLISPSSGAAEGSMSIKVNRVATKDKTLGTVSHPTTTTNITANETRIYVNGTEIKVPANATLDEVVGAINSKKATTSIQAFARKFSDTDYKIFMSCAKEGEKITFETIANKLAGTFESNADPLNLAGTLVIGGEEKVITPTMSLTDIATLISTVPTFAATVGGTGPYTLDVTENGGAVVLTNVATEKMMGQLGLAESDTTADFLKAEFSLDGNPTLLYSKTNHIEGIYHKTTIDLLAPSDGAEISVSIGRNPVGVLQAIDEFILAYNDLIQFAEVQTAKDPQNDFKPKENAYLANNRQFINMIDRIKRIYSNMGTGGVTGLKHLNEIGIKKDSSGMLIKDETKLNNKLDTNLDEVEQIFAFVGINTTGGYFHTKSRPKELPSGILGKDLKVSVIKNAAGEFAARLYLDDQGVISEDTSIAIGSTDITISGDSRISIKGPKGTIYEGFEFSYFGPVIPTPVDPATIAETQGFRFSQGIGDLISEKLEDMVMKEIRSDRASDQKNELNQVAYRVRKEKQSAEKKLEELKSRNARMMQRERRKAERFQRDMEKVSQLMSTFTPMMASMFGR